MTRWMTSGVVSLVGPDHFYDSVKAAKKGRAPDGLPMFGGVGFPSPPPITPNSTRVLTQRRSRGSLWHRRRQTKS